MRILIVVPTPLHKTTAGSRIRYDRLNFQSDVFDVKVSSIDEVELTSFEEFEVVVFSKTYSVGAIAIARRVKQQGKIVGIDFFDDYFSITHDARLTRFRTWAACFIDVFDFALCSTATMKRVVNNFSPDLPVLVIPDAYPEIDGSKLAVTVASKRRQALSTGVIDIVWFGIGSNPFFPVGLNDLAAFSWALDSISPTPFNLRLTVVTDDASLTPGCLSRLQSLTIEPEIKKWSLDSEERALKQALIAFVPVNGQNFSRAKSMNRALTAISAGAQVFSPGYPLYSDLKDIIYDRGDHIVSDLINDCLKIRKSNAEKIVELTSEVSALPAVTSDLFVFLVKQLRIKGRLRAQVQMPPMPQALIFGRDVDRIIIAASAKAGVIIVRAPHCKLERSFDIRLEYNDERAIDVWIKPIHISLLAEPLRSSCSSPQILGKEKMVRLDSSTSDLLDYRLRVSPKEDRMFLYETDLYRMDMSKLESICSTLFPGVRFLSSDIRSHMQTPGTSMSSERVSQ